MTTATTEAGAVGVYATLAAAPKPLDPEGRFFAVTSTTGVRVIDLEQQTREGALFPERKTGHYSVHDAVSFALYLDKHGTADTEVWADRFGSRVTAVINAHGTDTADHSDHRVYFAVRTTPAWRAWVSHDNVLLDQGVFAEHIEDRLTDIVKPTGADMLELAQSIEATIGVKFESSKRLESGERQLGYRENIDARAGRTGQLAIPREFELGLTPYEDGPGYLVKARFRYRITEGKLRLGYKLDRPEDVLTKAFDDIATDVANRLNGRVVLFGEPA